MPNDTSWAEDGGHSCGLGEDLTIHSGSPSNPNCYFMVAKAATADRDERLFRRKDWIILVPIRAVLLQVRRIIGPALPRRLRFDTQLSAEYLQCLKDRVPSLFPGRPIRPLPKRKLREKLSPEAIQTIEYPPVTANSIPLFFYPTYPARIPASDISKALGVRQKPANEIPDCAESLHPYGFEFLSMASYARKPQPTLQENVKCVAPPDQGTSLCPNISATSSVDGYDSLENTNNKKKRKIPSASDSILRGSLFVTSDPPERLEPASEADCGTASSPAASEIRPVHNEGIAGPGRGRLGRAVHARSPLRTLSDGNNVWPNRQSKTGLGPGQGTNGIISTAIANAKRLAPSGQENYRSMLREPYDSEKTTPIASQFTFTCGIHVKDASSATSGPAECQQSKQLAHGKGVPSALVSDSKAINEGRRRSRANSRRKLERDIMLAARDRRQAAVDAYLHHPPRLESVWICEFCEYERIFGSPPKALIREYEMKDRQIRQEEADRRRLLEKAKAKSRKGKKSIKGANGAQSASQSPSQVPEEHAVVEAAPMKPTQSRATQSEVDYEDKAAESRPRGPPDILGLHMKDSALESVLTV